MASHRENQSNILKKSYGTLTDKFPSMLLSRRIEPITKYSKDVNVMFSAHRVDILELDTGLFVMWYGYQDWDHPYRTDVPYAHFTARKVDGIKRIPPRGSLKESAVRATASDFLRESFARTDAMFLVDPNGIIRGNVESELGRKLDEELRMSETALFVKSYKHEKPIDKKDLHKPIYDPRFSHALSMSLEKALTGSFKIKNA